MKKQQLSSFYLEALILVVTFVAMILVLTGVFGTSRAQSVKAKQLSQAVTLAANAAEALSDADGLDRAAAILDEGGNVHVERGQLEAAYLADGSPCGEGRSALRLTADWTPSEENASLITSRICVYAAEEDRPVYTLETAKYREEAAP